MISTIILYHLKVHRPKSYSFQKRETDTYLQQFKIDSCRYFSTSKLENLEILVIILLKHYIKKQT